MENENNSNKDTTYQEKSKIFVIKDTPEEEEKFSIKETNSFQKEAMKENNGILKKTTTSESFPKKVEKYDKSKREINQEINSGKIGDMATVMTNKHRCQRPLRDIIGKRAQRREELEKMEEDLRQRLDMLECSIPAVMIWNIWNIMSQGAPICRVKRILEKQFKDTRELSCRSTPSCHYDYRVREVEAERKLALKKVEEARILCSEKLATLEERKRKLDEARKIQEEQKNAIEQLNEENRMLQEAMKRKTIEMDESVVCECGDIQCKQRHLSKVSSVTSIESGDIQCLEKLQRFAEEEVITKREIAELERREEAYMRTLQQADELWSKMEGDMVSTTSALQEQLDMKTTANQQLANRVCELEDALEKCRGRLVACRTELEKFLSIETVEATIGRDDDVAKVADKEVAVKVKVVHRPIGRIDDIATVKDDEVLAKVEVADEGILAEIKVVDEEALAIIEVEDKEALVITEVVDEEALAIIEVEDKEALVITEVVDEEALAITEVEDKEALAITEVVDRLIGRIDDIATVKDDEVLAKVEVADEEILAETKVVDEEALVIIEVEDKEALERVALPDADIEPPFIVDDKFVSVKPDLVDLTVDRPVDLVEIEDAESIVRPEDVDEEALIITEVEDKEALARVALPDVDIEPPFIVDDKFVSVKPDLVDLAVDRPIDLVQIEDAERIVPPEDVAYEQQRFQEVREYLGQLDSLEELYTDDGVPCAPTFVCNDVVTSPTGMTDEELIALSVEHPVLIKVRDETVITEEREREFEKELVKKLDNAVDEVEKREKKEDEIPGIDIERKIVEKVERIAEDVDVRETVTLRAIEEDDDRPVTMPKDRAPEVKKIKAANEQNQDIVIQRETILSWIDAIDTIRTIAAKHPECYEVEKDADILSEQVGSYIGIIPKKVEEENATIKDKELKPVIKMDSEPFVDEKEKDIPTEIKIKEPTVYITEEEKFEPDKFPVADVEKAPITKAIEEKIKMEEPTPVLNGKEDSLFLDAAIKEEIKNEKPAIKKEEIETAEPLPIAEIEKNEVTELSPIEVMEKKEKDEAVKLPPISDIVREEKIETVELPSISDIAKEEKIEAAEVSPITDIVKKEQIEAEELLPRADVVIDEKIEIIQPIPTLPTIKKEMEEEIEDLDKMLKVEIKKEKDEEIEEVPLPEEVIPSIELFEKKEEEEIPQIKKEEIPTIAPLLQPTPKIEKEVPEEKRPEMIQINLTIPIAEIKPTEMEVPAIPFDSRLVAQPYLIIAKIKEKELLQTIPAKLPCTECCLQPPTETTKQFEIPQIDVPQIKVVQTEVIQSEVVQTKMMQTEIVQHEVEQAKIVQTESVKTEVVQITSQTISTSEPPRIRNTSEYLKPAELKASRTENAGDRPEITARKMLWRKRLKDQSTVTTSSTGSQTDKTSHVSHDRVVRDERERARVPTDELLQSIKIAAGIARPDTEREIRTINYGGRSDETGKAACNCCTCGKTPTPPSTKYKLDVQPQIDATPPVAATLKHMFIRPKIDQPILHDRLCSDCKVKIQSKMLQEKHHIKKIIKKISHDQESSYVSLSSESCRAISQKRVIKKRDQGCLAKIPKQKINPIAQKRKDNLQSISEEKSTVEPLSESCICFKLEKTGVEPIKKGNCYCGD